MKTATYQQNSFNINNNIYKIYGKTEVKVSIC